jgi:D-tyrosyl-tRNA(Tyr) deacylase
MIGLIQRVSSAKVEVNQEIIGSIDQGILLLLGVEKDDTVAKADRLLQRIMGYRIFSDDSGRMNHSLTDIQAELLIVSQFTLPANTQKGMRPSFSSAGSALLGKVLYEYMIRHAKQSPLKIQSGQFGANMQVSLTNDGPVTFWLQTNTS